MRLKTLLSDCGDNEQVDIDMRGYQALERMIGWMRQAEHECRVFLNILYLLTCLHSVVL